MALVVPVPDTVVSREDIQWLKENTFTALKAYTKHFKDEMSKTGKGHISDQNMLRLLDILDKHIDDPDPTFIKGKGGEYLFHLYTMIEVRDFLRSHGSFHTINFDNNRVVSLIRRIITWRFNEKILNQTVIRFTEDGRDIESVSAHHDEHLTDAEVERIKRDLERSVRIYLERQQRVILSAVEQGSGGQPDSPDFNPTVPEVNPNPFDPKIIKDMFDGLAEKLPSLPDLQAMVDDMLLRIFANSKTDNPPAMIEPMYPAGSNPLLLRKKTVTRTYYI